MAAKLPSVHNEVNEQDLDHAVHKTGNVLASGGTITPTDSQKQKSRSFSESIDALTGDAMDSMLNEIDQESARPHQVASEPKVDPVTGRPYKLFEVIDNLLNECEQEWQEAEEKENMDKMHKHCATTIQVVDENTVIEDGDIIEDGTEAHLTFLKQRTFERILKFEVVMARYTQKYHHPNQSTQWQQPPSDMSLISTSALFHLPASKDPLLHGYLRLIASEPEWTDQYTEYDFLCGFEPPKMICPQIPAVMLRLIHRYYSMPNNQYKNELKRCGIRWNDHRVIVQHENTWLWMWRREPQDSPHSLYPSNEFPSYTPNLQPKIIHGQSSLLRDELKGFTRFVHIGHKSQSLEALQVVEANCPIDPVRSVRHDYEDQRSALLFRGREYLSITKPTVPVAEVTARKEYFGIPDDQDFMMEFKGPNHEYFCMQWVSCWNDIITAEQEKEMFMLRRVDLFPDKSNEGYHRNPVPERVVTMMDGEPVQNANEDQKENQNENASNIMDQSNQMNEQKTENVDTTKPIIPINDWLSNPRPSFAGLIPNPSTPSKTATDNPIEKKKEENTKQTSTVPTLDRLAEYVEALQTTSDPAKHEESTRLIRKLLSNEQQPPIQEVIDCGIIQRLIYLIVKVFPFSIHHHHVRSKRGTISIRTRTHIPLIYNADSVQSIQNKVKTANQKQSGKVQ